MDLNANIRRRKNPEKACIHYTLKYAFTYNGQHFIGFDILCIVYCQVLKKEYERKQKLLHFIQTNRKRRENYIKTHWNQTIIYTSTIHMMMMTVTKKKYVWEENFFPERVKELRAQAIE